MSKTTAPAHWINDEVCAAYRAADDPVLCFPHAQRTGGTALTRRVLQEVYGAERVYTSQTAKPFKHWPDITAEDLAGFAAYAGHSNMRDVAIGRPVFYISLLRDPVLRAVSLYYYCKRKDNHALQELANSTSLEEFHRVGAERKPAYFVNVQCRRICGRPDVERSIEVARRSFVGLGITEELPAFVEAIAPKVGWPPVVLEETENLASRRQEEVSDAFRAEIEERDAADVALLRWVRHGTTGG